jgi:hypothetical protein
MGCLCSKQYDSSPWGVEEAKHRLQARLQEKLNWQELQRTRKRTLVLMIDQLGTYQNPCALATYLLLPALPWLHALATRPPGMSPSPGSLVPVSTQL